MAHASNDVVQAAETFAEVARILAAHDDPQSTLERIVRLAVDTLDACEHAGITFSENGRVTSPASSGDVPRTLDAIHRRRARVRASTPSGSMRCSRPATYGTRSGGRASPLGRTRRPGS